MSEFTIEKDWVKGKKGPNGQAFTRTLKYANGNLGHITVLAEDIKQAEERWEWAVKGYKKSNPTIKEVKSDKRRKRGSKN